MRGNNSDSGLGSQSSSSAPQSRHTSDIESKFFFFFSGLLYSKLILYLDFIPADAKRL